MGAGDFLNGLLVGLSLWMKSSREEHCVGPFVHITFFSLLLQLSLSNVPASDSVCADISFA